MGTDEYRYRRSGTKTYRCPVHGDVQARPGKRYTVACPLCAAERKKNKKKSTKRWVEVMPGVFKEVKL